MGLLLIGPRVWTGLWVRALLQAASAHMPDSTDRQVQAVKVPCWSAISREWRSRTPMLSSRSRNCPKPGRICRSRRSC